jgi:tRNA (cmo5U34)-methyltransferase
MVRGFHPRFHRHGRYFVFEREYQLEAFCRLIPDPSQNFRVLELCCGEGLLAEQVLTRFPAASLHGLDGSPGMLATARRRLERFGERFTYAEFDLGAADWRSGDSRYWAILSSLAIHHLDGAGKARLFRDVHSMLEPAGVFLVSDLVLPADNLGITYAGWAYDEAVRQRPLANFIVEHYQ